MSRKRWIWDTHERRLVPEEEFYKGWSPVEAPYVIPDEMDALMHPCTGRYITSKAKFRQVTRAHGCTEVGNEEIKDCPEKRLDFSGLNEEIRRAWEKENG